MSLVVKIGLLAERWLVSVSEVRAVGDRTQDFRTEQLHLDVTQTPEGGMKCTVIGPKQRYITSDVFEGRPGSEPD